MQHNSSECPDRDCWSGTAPLCLLSAHLIPGRGKWLRGNRPSRLGQGAPRALLAKRQRGGAGALPAAEKRGILLELATSSSKLASTELIKFPCIHFGLMAVMLAAV